MYGLDVNLIIAIARSIDRHLVLKKTKNKVCQVVRAIEGAFRCAHRTSGSQHTVHPDTVDEGEVEQQRAATEHERRVVERRSDIVRKTNGHRPKHI